LLQFLYFITLLCIIIITLHLHYVLITVLFTFLYVLSFLLSGHCICKYTYTQTIVDRSV